MFIFCYAMVALLVLLGFICGISQIAVHSVFLIHYYICILSAIYVIVRATEYKCFLYYVTVNSVADNPWFIDVICLHFEIVALCCLLMR